MERNCQNCNKIIVYKSIGAMQHAIKKNSWCKSCSAKKRSCEIDFQEKHRKIFLEKYAENPDWHSGPNNGFYGKKHSEISKTKIRLRDMSYTKTKEFSDAVKKGNKGNANCIPVYEIWIKKYGKKRADELDSIRRKKWSESASGERNPMYGKPAPQGSGNGWSGWYKGWFFRSFHELAYMINVIEKENLQWESAEKKDLAISYIDWNGQKRNYFADFLISGKILVECKPKALMKSKTVQMKAIAAEVFCKERGWTYQLIDPGKLNKKEIRKLYDSREIKLTERYEEKWYKR